MEEKQINEIVENFKKDFSGSTDYLSGVNDAAYSMFRYMLKHLETGNKKIVKLVKFPKTK